jgi:hypothetical protein
MQPKKLVSSALGMDLYAAIGIVPNPACYSEHVRLSFDKPAETHALHASADNKAASLDGFFCGSHAPNEVVILTKESAS